MANRFRNPSNGYEENVGQAWLWCLLLGPIYFAAKGVWFHAAASLLLAIGRNAAVSGNLDALAL